MTTTETIDVRLSKPQTLTWRNLQRQRTVVAPWGRGVGKSWFIRLCWYLLVAAWDGKNRPGGGSRGVRIILLMPTLEQAKKVHAHLLLEELDGKWKFLRAKVNRTEWRVTFPGGSWIQWVTAERAAHIRGLRCDAVFVDECDAIDSEIIDAIVHPWLSEPHSLAMLMFAGTPERGRYGLLYKKYQMGLRGESNHFACHATYRDVPEYVDVERIERERPFIEPSLFAREWLCDFDAAEGLVYPMFSPKVHVCEPDPKAQWTEILVGGDHGYEDPAVFLVIGVSGHGKDAVCHVLAEVYRNHETIEELLAHVRKIKAEHPRARWYLDTSEPKTNLYYKQNAGISLYEVDKTIEDGVSAVAHKLFVRRPDNAPPFTQLYVSPACKSLIREFGLYRRRRDPKNKERILDDIEDKNNHAMDALRYAILGRFGKPPAARGMI